MKGLLIAIQFLTRLPTPRIGVSTDAFARSMRWFPAVGLLIGALVALAGRTGLLLDAWVGSLLAVIAWTAVTGALHLDGLGDIADASGAAHKGGDRDRLLAVLADPHVGSFAVVAIILQLAAKLVLTHALLERDQWTALALVPFAARMGPLVWTRLPSLHDGLGALFKDSVRPVDLLCWGAALLLAAWFVPALLAAPALMLLWAAWLTHRIGGISGDGHGAGIELVESGLLLAILAGGACAWAL